MLMEVGKQNTPCRADGLAWFSVIQRIKKVLRTIV